MTFQSLRSIYTAIRNVVSCTSKILSSSNFSHPRKNAVSTLRCISCTHFHTTVRRPDLMEFFDKEENWNQAKIYCGRPWKLDELRIKSNEDLHKLWYVLLKERNMLMTMEAEYERECENFPSPERIFKVEESMENILSVTNERNEAFNVLETGKTGEPKGQYVRHALGFRYYRRFNEHPFPKFMNRRYALTHSRYEKWMGKYLALYAEKKRNLRKLQERRDKHLKKRLKKRFPHLTPEELEFGVEQRKNSPY